MKYDHHHHSPHHRPGAFCVETELCCFLKKNGAGFTLSTDVGKVCRGWSHRIYECTETPNEATWAPEGGRTALGRASRPAGQAEGEFLLLLDFIYCTSLIPSGKYCYCSVLHLCTVHFYSHSCVAGPSQGQRNLEPVKSKEVWNQSRWKKYWTSQDLRICDWSRSRMPWTSENWGSLELVEIYEVWNQSETEFVWIQSKLKKSGTKDRRRLRLGDRLCIINEMYGSGLKQLQCEMVE